MRTDGGGGSRRREEPARASEAARGCEVMCGVRLSAGCLCHAGEKGAVYSV